MRYFICSAALMLLLSAAIVGCSESSDTASAPVVPDPAAADAAAADAVEATPVAFANTECPIMGGGPTAELTAEYQGKTIGFCCDGCPEKWADLSDDVKAEKFAKVAVNADHDHADGNHDHSDRSGE